MEVGIFVVSVADGAMLWTGEHILRCRQVGVKTMIFFTKKVNLVPDAEMLELVEMEVRELFQIMSMTETNL